MAAAIPPIGRGMRVLRVDDPEPGRPSLDLHPYLTVVHGLPEAARRRVVEVVASAAAGIDPGVGGLVEAHGLVLELDGRTLRTLDLDAEIDVVVRPDDLPVGASHAEPLAGSEVEQARAAMAEAERAHETLSVAAGELRDEWDEAADRAVRAASTLTVAGSDEGMSPVEALDGLLARRAELAERVAALETPDVRPVEEALQAVRAGRDAGSSEAPTQQRLDAALAEVQRLEQARRPREHDPADLDELERAHDSVREAERRATGRLGGRRADRRLEEALEWEQAVLDRLGFPTYTAIVMATSAPTVDHGDRARLEAARRAVAEAEAELAQAAEELPGSPSESPVAVAALRHALEAAGVDFGSLDLSGTEVAEVAEVWLVEMAEASTERMRLAAELEQVESQLSAVSPQPELEAAIAHQRTMADRLDAQETLVAAAAEVAQSAAERVALAEQVGLPETGLPDHAASRGSVDGSTIADEVERFLLARLAAQRAVSYAGSVPLVIDDALAGRPHEVVTALLEQLQRVADHVQIVYLTDDDAVADWAAASDGARVGLIRR